MRDTLGATSHGGGTIHAYGVKVPANSYGMDGQTGSLTAASGKPLSIMEEAQAAGLAVGIVNSGDLNEPGTGCFLAHVSSRAMSEEIVAQIIESNAAVILGGGGQWFLPNGTKGPHGPGRRTDGRDLIEEARAAGYTIVYDRETLARAAEQETTKKLLGIFALRATFHAQPEEELAETKLPLYIATAPTIAEMTRAAIQVLARHDTRFLLVVEEEGTDNFANVNNAAGSLEALRRADEAIGVARHFVATRADTLLLTAADSDAGGMQVVAGNPPQVRASMAPMDGRQGTGSPPFASAPDHQGQTHPFVIAWAGDRFDVYGAVVVRAAGLNANLVRGNFDNTEIYRVMYRTLFGIDLSLPR